MIRLATVFSGIGAIEQAMFKMGLEHEIVFACDTGERYIDTPVDEINAAIRNMNEEEKQLYIQNLYKKTGKKNFVKESYLANYDLPADRWYDDIRFLNGVPFNGQVDLIVGGSPCQPFSAIGKRAGLEDARGTLFYDYARLINEIQPKVFIFENVVGMLTHNKGKTYKAIKEVFESLNYNLYDTVLNSVDFDIPQDRKRLFVVGFRNDLVLNGEFTFPIGKKTNRKMFDFLENGPVAARHYLGKKGFEFVTNPKYRNRARVNHEIIQTQKANQQYNWNGDFVFEPLSNVENNNEIMNRAYVGTWNEQQGVIRQLTYRECLRLMGFSDQFNIVVPNVPAYRQAGNSIVVNVLQAILTQIMNVVDLNE